MNALWKRIVAAFHFLVSRYLGEPVIELVVVPEAENWHKFKRIEYPVPPLKAGPFEPRDSFDISHKGDAVVYVYPNRRYQPPIRIAHREGRTITNVQISSITVEGELVWVNGGTFPYQYILEFGPIDVLTKGELVEPMIWAYKKAARIPTDKQILVQPMSSEVAVSDVLDTALYRVFRELEQERESGSRSVWKRGDPNDYAITLSYRDGLKGVSQKFTLRFRETPNGVRTMTVLDSLEANSNV